MIYVTFPHFTPQHVRSHTRHAPQWNRERLCGGPRGGGPVLHASHGPLNIVQGAYNHSVRPCALYTKGGTLLGKYVMIAFPVPVGNNNVKEREGCDGGGGYSCERTRSSATCNNNSKCPKQFVSQKYTARLSIQVHRLQVVIISISRVQPQGLRGFRAGI